MPLAAVDTQRPGATMLGDLHGALGDQQFTRILGAAGIRIYSCLIDTNVLVNDLRAAARTGTISNLMEAARIGSLRLFASTAVRDEVPRIVSEMARKGRFDPEPVLRVWRAFAPWIFFLDPTGLQPVGSRVRRLVARDPQDVQSGQLIEVLDPDVVLSLDKDLDEFDTVARRRGQLKAITVAYRDKSVKDALQLGLGLGGSLTLVIGWELLSGITRVLIRSASRIPRPLLIIAVSALTAYFLVGHRWRRDRLEPVRGSADIRIGSQPFLYALLKEVTARVSVGMEAQRLLIGVERPKTPSRNAAQHAARILSRSVGQLSLARLAQAMAEDGYKPLRRPLVRSVHDRLRRYPRLFSSTPDGLWTLHSYPPFSEPGENLRSVG